MSRAKYIILLTVTTGALCAARVMQFASAYDYSKGLFEPGIMRTAVYLICGLVAAGFAALCFAGRSRPLYVDKRTVRPTLFSSLCAAAFTALAAAVTLLDLYSLVGDELTVNSLVLMVVDIIFVVYSASLLPFIIKGEHSSSVDSMLFLGTVGTVIWIFITYIPMTEMSTTDHYMLRVLAQAVFALLTLYSIKSIAVARRSRPVFFLSAAALTFALSDILAPYIVRLALGLPAPTLELREMLRFLYIAAYCLCLGTFFVQNAAEIQKPDYALGDSVFPEWKTLD